MKERKTYFSALSAENQRLANEIAVLRKDNQDLRNGMQAAAAAGNREALNRELAAANTRLVRKLREVLTAWEQERAAGFQEQLRHTEQFRQLHEQRVAVAQKVAGLVRQLHERLTAAEQKAAKLEQENHQMQRLLATRVEGDRLDAATDEIIGVGVILQGDLNVSVAETARHRMSELQDLKGELEGLQDLLSSLEQERAGMLQERVRQSDEVRWLKELQATAGRRMEGLEKEIARLQEGLSPVPAATWAAAAGMEKEPESRLLIDADDDPAN
jgi:predicted  nucleic acid-binding Zn-ribbon protein